MKVTLKQADADWLRSRAHWLVDATCVKTKNCRDGISVGWTSI